MSSSVSSSGPGKAWEPPTPEALQPELPQYEILKLLGRGGMGAVYKARQKSLKREVAIKVLPPTIDDGGMQFAERFKAEAEAMARLNHPGVVAVYDAGETPGGLLYIVMEFVEGTDVSQMIRSSGKLPPDYAYSITAHVCDALAYAHANGLIHRDIKPANIMVDKEGRVKVADFGLAKMTNENSGFTQTNMAVGTPDFVAPEALYPGVPLDGRADLYAVGVMLYQMLTGSIPRGAFKPASVIVPGVDARFDQIVLKAMQVDREERYSSAVELRQHLDTLLIPVEVPVPTVQQQPENAALPQAGMTGARTVVAQRPSGASTQQSRPTPQPVRGPSHSYAPPPPKSKAPLFLGLAAVAAVVVGVFVMLSGKKQEIDVASDEPKGPASAPTSQTTSSASVVSTTDVPFTNTLGMKFVPVPDTQVLFCIHEVRYQDYAAYAAEALGVDGTWKDQSADGFTPTENKEHHPVMKVSWEDAQKFCTWLSQKEGKTYRLPTDEEWSIAVGLGRAEKRPKGTTPAMLSQKENTVFPWGGDFPPKTKDQAGNYSDDSRKAKAPNGATQYLEDYDDGFPTTAPVMSFKPNKLGLYDLGGNVWEWCEDWYDNAQKDRVLRGGSWNHHDRGLLLSSIRNHPTPGSRNLSIGFRCVLVPGSAPTASVNTSAPAAASVTLAPAPQAYASASAPTATKDAPFINTLGMKFVPVPITGGPTDKQRVLFSVWETRVQDYDVFVKETKHEWPKSDFEQGGTHPAVNVNWTDATAFCAWLTERERKVGKLSTSESYRLPNDHEWSCAVGIGEREDAMKLPRDKDEKIADVLPWGSTWPPLAGTGNYAGQELKPSKDAGKYHEIIFLIEGFRDRYTETAPVGSFNVNRFGLYDLSGNVWEVCEEWHDAIAQKDRVLRGASWMDRDRNFALSSKRLAYAAARRSSNLGFRCVLYAESAPTAVAPATKDPAKPAAPAPAMPTPPAPASSPGLPSELAALDTQFIALQKERLTAPFEADVAKLNTGYLGGIAKKIAEEKAAGHLDGILALEAEQKRINDMQPVPDVDEDKTLASLKALRVIYRTTYAKLITARLENLKALIDPLEKRLAQMEADFTKADRVADAKTVRGYREVLHEGSAGTPARNQITGGEAAKMMDTDKSVRAPISPAVTLAMKNGFTNSLGMKLVPVKGADVLFCIHETRHQDYAVYAAEVADVDGGWKNQSIEGIPSGGEDNHPVVGVSWHDAHAF